MLHTLVPFRRSQPARLGLYDELDSVFDAFFRGLTSPASGGAPSAFAPRMDVSETEKEYRIDVELPGLDQKDIAVTLENGVLAISGERKDETEDKDERGFSHRESWRGSFQRALRLPEDADEKGVTASTRSGVLTVVVPKLPKPEPQVRTIPVHAS